MKKQFVFHPILFAIFPILAFYYNNIREVTLEILTLPLLIALSVTIVLWISLSLLLKNKIKAGLIITFILILFFTYGHFYNLVKGSEILGIIIGRHKMLLPLLGLLIIVVSYLTIRTKKDLINLSKIFNVIGIFLVAYSSFNILIYEYRARTSIESLSADKSISSEAKKLKVEKAIPPDIYYFIFDRYAREDTLNDYFDFDNTEFLDYLEEKGFFIAAKSYSNYPLTHFSLASSLNMNYFNNLLEKSEINPDEKTLYYNMIEDNKVGQLLKSKGYLYIHLGDWWEATRKNKNADININYGVSSNIPEFNRELLETTAFAPLGSSKKVGLLDSRDMMRERHLYKFEKLIDTVQLRSPKFIFAHFLINHPPFVFDKDGRPLSKELEKERGENKNFVNSLIFTNKKIMELIDGILKNSKKPPIIILQGDEGPHMEALKKDKVDVKIKNEAYMKRSAILNAYYLPDADFNDLNKNITPVNTFRLIFNLYFEADYKMLENNIYISAPKHEKRFIDITDRIRQAEENLKD